MDATPLSSHKLAIVIAFSSLLLAASPQAYAQPTFVVNGTAGTSFSFTVPGSGNSLHLSISLSDNSTPNFTAAVTYPNSGTQWVFLNSGCAPSQTGTLTLAAPATLNVSQGCSVLPNLQLGNQPASITLAAAGVTGATITISPGAAQGTITANNGTNALTMSAAAGGSTQGTITLATTNTTAIGFTFAVAQPAPTWISSVQQTSGTPGAVSAGTSAVLTVNANAAGLAAGSVTGTININYNNTTISVLVTLNVGGTGSGGLTPSQSAVNWSFNTGGTQQVSYVTIGTPATTYTATVQSNITPAGVYWLSLSSTTMSNSTSVSGPGNSQLTLASNSNLLTLATGTYTAPILVTDSNGNSTFIYVYLTVNGGTSTITALPNPITLNAAYGSNVQVSTPVTITSAVAGTLSASVSGTGLTTVTGGGVAISAGGSVPLTIFGNASGLAQTTYAGTLTVTVNSTTQTFPINFVIGTGSGGGNTSSSLAPSTLQFNYQTDGTQGGNVPAQQLMVGGTASFNVTATQTNTVGSLTWLTVPSSSGTAPQTLFVSVNPAGLTPGAYTGQVKVAFSDGTSQTTTVNLTVMTGSPLVYAQPGTIIINQQTGTVQNYVYLYSTDGSTIPLTVSQPTASWLSIVSALPTTSQSSFAVQAVTSNLSNGMNTGTIAVNYGTAVLNIPVVAYVTTGTGGGGNGILTFNPTSVTLNAQPNSTTQVSTVLSVGSSSNTPTFVSASTSESTCTQTTWLSLNGFTGGYVYAGSPQAITVVASPFGLPAGSCTGSISFSANGTTQTVPVTFNIGGGITLSTSSMSFAYTSGGTAPAAQTFTVTNSAGTAVNYTVTATAGSGGTWLSATPASGTTGTTGAISVSVNPTALAAGTYSGTVAVTPSGGTASNITVTLTVTTPTVSASPSTLAFSYQAGGSAPAAQNITVSGGPFTASASSTGNWLSVSPTSGTAAATISASVNPSGLSAGVYNGTITVAGSNGASGSTTVSVTLTVTAPLPTVAAVVNAASFLGGPIAPGEIISIGGTGLGPASPAYLTLDSNGNVATTIGGVSVTVGGFASPLVYASSTQINAIVPYEIAGQIAPVLVVKYLGQTSNGVSLQAAATAPAIFTQNASGSGPGAILNQDNSVNGPGHPAAKGTIVQVFMTGEGKTTPTAVTGKVNNVSNPSQLPIPLIQPVSATVGAQPAQVVFAAGAPGAVAGVLQVNLVIPSTAGSGAQPIVISVGTSPSQAGVTVSVQ
ncbi:MAG TPA: hypothetical protein VKB88_26040 [Bryobacteraceae bacterium]|nr:hypothetical protein [Bryobacteraceae bacterium]